MRVYRNRKKEQEQTRNNQIDTIKEKVYNR